MNCPCLVSIKVHCLMSFLFSPFQSPSNPSIHTLSTLHTTFLYLSTTVYFFLNDPTKLITICVLFSCVLSLSFSLSLSLFLSLSWSFFCFHSIYIFYTTKLLKWAQYPQILPATYFHTHTHTYYCCSGTFWNASNPQTHTHYPILKFLMQGHSTFTTRYTFHSFALLQLSLLLNTLELCIDYLIKVLCFALSVGVCVCVCVLCPSLSFDPNHS